MKNLLLKLWEEADGKTIRTTKRGIIDQRGIASERYAWGIPNEKALKEIAQHAPIVEIGAGLGYWARLLQDQGVDIYPVDIKPPVTGFTKVFKGSARTIKKHQDKTLFLCWVPIELAQEVIELYQGEKILYVGEPVQETTFKVEKEITIPQWEGFNDSLFVLKRKQNE